MTHNQIWITFAAFSFGAALVALILETALIRAREERDRLRRELDKSTWTTHEFEIVLDGPDELTDELVDRLYEADCSDATPSCRSEYVYVAFHRLAPSLNRAMDWACHDIQKAGYRVSMIELAPAKPEASR